MKFKVWAVCSVLQGVADCECRFIFTDGM